MVRPLANGRLIGLYVLVRAMLSLGDIGKVTDFSNETTERRYRFLRGITITYDLGYRITKNDGDEDGEHFPEGSSVW